ncbi:MAG: hypothetical protein CVU90_14040 [Firmicutes bacterium HGW-Firmicutes-15]|nr:MAG: hypothetical protein CVU90_14040 [Firmicutes bacterium HGW-Firmicutes-15]
MTNHPDFGDESLWHLAVQNYYPKIVNFVYYLTRDRFLAEDIAQEAFARAIDKFDQLKDPDKFLPWLTSIALNLVRTQIKHTQRVVSVSDIDSCIPFPSNDNFPMEMAENKEIQKLVQNAIAQLSPQEQKAITMRYYLDMKDKDIAFALGVTIGTVKKQLFRARSKLFQYLRREGDENE